MEPTLLRFQNVSKSYDDNAILKNINLTLEPGTVLGLLGKNGAGKTSLFRAAINLISCDAGQVFLFDQPVDKITKEIKSHIGYVPQQPFGYEGFKVKDALSLHKRFYSNWDSQLEQMWIERFQLDLTAQVNNLSVGQRQSLALIMAMAYKPKLLILDEPVASLDPLSRREFMTDLFDLALDSHSGIIFSSHITSDIERVASHVAILKDGELIVNEELDTLRDSVRLIQFQNTNINLSKYNVLNRNENTAVIANYDGQPIEGTTQVSAISLEQLFVEIHSR